VVPSDAPTIGGGRYAIVSKIAEGGMAGVYRAWDHKLRVWRAVKILAHEYAQRDVLRARFESEAKTMARLDHPHVIHVYDVGTRESLPYMVMELAEGGTVNGWIDAYGPMPPRLAVDAVIQVARGLGAAHALGVVHRDVKPHNVLVTSDGLCKVTDFGIARVLDQEADGQTRTGATMGTVGYMAPEQRADAKMVDERADIYALGALLFKLVTGRVMVDLFLVEHSPDLLAPIPEPLHEVIVRACYHDRERRYPTTDALIKVLNEVAELLPAIPPNTASLAIPLQKPLRDYTQGFPEIALLLGGAEAARPAAGAARRAHATPVPLPYTMSRPAPKPRITRDDDEELPAYLQEDGKRPERRPRSVPEAPPSMPSIPPTRPVRGAEGAPAAEEPDDPPSLHPVTVARGERRSLVPPWIAGLLIATALLWALALALTGYGIWDLRGRQADARAARAQVYATIESEQTLLQDLLNRGVPRSHVQVLTQLYDVYANTQTEPARELAAMTYILAAQQEGATFLGDTPNLAMVRTRNLMQAWKAYQAAKSRWDAAAGMPQGRLAQLTGLAGPR
jgi:serine/threonine protein kinase